MSLSASSYTISDDKHLIPCIKSNNLIESQPGLEKKHVTSLRINWQKQTTKTKPSKQITTRSTLKFCKSVFRASQCPILLRINTYIQSSQKHYFAIILGTICTNTVVLGVFGVCCMLQSLSYQHSVTLEPLNQISGFQLTGQDTNIRTFINIKAVLQHIQGFGKLLSGRCVQKYKLPVQDDVQEAWDRSHRSKPRCGPSAPRPSFHHCLQSLCTHRQMAWEA